jgi:hypothetical protein
VYYLLCLKGIKEKCLIYSSSSKGLVDLLTTGEGDGCEAIFGFFDDANATTEPKTPTTSNAPPKYNNQFLCVMVVKPVTLIFVGVSGIKPGPFNGGV